MTVLRKLHKAEIRNYAAINLEYHSPNHGEIEGIAKNITRKSVANKKETETLFTNLFIDIRLNTYLHLLSHEKQPPKHNINESNTNTKTNMTTKLLQNTANAITPHQEDEQF